MKDIQIKKSEEQSSQPGQENKMTPEPISIRDNYNGSDKLKDKVVLLTGGDSGIGKSIALHFAREGAHLAIIYLSEDDDARQTMAEIENEGTRCLLLKGDIKDEEFCKKAVNETISHYGSLNCVINNAAMQFPAEHIEEITSANLHTTFETNIYPYFYIVKAAIGFLNENDTIINTTSVTAYRGSEHLIDYASTKGAIVSFTRSLSKSLAKKGIRVNAVAPGPIWTPLIPATFNGEDLENFGKDVPLGRPGQPAEVAPAYVYLASQDSSYMTGQVLHVNGGEIIGG
ncbi:SDR family oxidoreductase [Maribacter stanieri]|uniref:NAD(P)-dependent dehydrogenase, short-chain alcohol dehydrogenase family n=1 Tax=Maribacter stanieri TaxID=440514 RepID=A0A1I6HA54_9FLAO|nr:SDR family oxidoreductase [Maribacter stanieri]SFR51409.1 NAD(P)-dependent dehydrogenase, short-chain alcohol dehydrogenase family [Maribacter stanieri]